MNKTKINKLSLGIVISSLVLIFAIAFSFLNPNYSYADEQKSSNQVKETIVAKSQQESSANFTVKSDYHPCDAWILNGNKGNIDISCRNSNIKISKIIFKGSMPYMEPGQNIFRISSGNMGLEPRGLTISNVDNKFFNISMEHGKCLENAMFESVTIIGETDSTDETGETGESEFKTLKYADEQKSSNQVEETIVAKSNHDSSENFTVESDEMAGHVWYMSDGCGYIKVSINKNSNIKKISKIILNGKMFPEGDGEDYYIISSGNKSWGGDNCLTVTNVNQDFFDIKIQGAEFACPSTITSATIVGETD